MERHQLLIHLHHCCREINRRLRIRSLMLGQKIDVITIDDDRIKNRVVRGSVEQTLNACSTQRQIGCAMRNAASAPRLVAIPGAVITSANWIPRPASSG
jgi:hypothetical protein